MAQVVIRSIDFETTAKEPADAEIIEIGITDALLDVATKEVVIRHHGSRLYNAARGIPVEVQAIHHIQPHMVAGMPLCDPDTLKAVALGDMGDGPPNFMCAHNAAYERHWLTDEVCGDVRWIDTFKCALRIWEDAPGHSNQVLKYHLGLGHLPEALCMPPHRAAPDSYVTAHILEKMLETERVSHLVHWTTLPRYYATCPLPKHKGKRWCDIPHDYLVWIIGPGNQIDADLKYAAQCEIDNRRATRT